MTDNLNILGENIAWLDCKVDLDSIEVAKLTFKTSSILADRVLKYPTCTAVEIFTHSEAITRQCRKITGQISAINLPICAKTQVMFLNKTVSRDGFTLLPVCCINKVDFFNINGKLYDWSNGKTRKIVGTSQGLIFIKTRFLEITLLNLRIP